MENWVTGSSQESTGCPSFPDPVSVMDGMKTTGVGAAGRAGELTRGEMLVKQAPSNELGRVGGAGISGFLLKGQCCLRYTWSDHSQECVCWCVFTCLFMCMLECMYDGVHMYICECSDVISLCVCVCLCVLVRAHVHAH